MELQPGDACEECRSQGLDHKLRYFYINLEEQLLKCESRSCLWPHNDEVSSDEEHDALPAHTDHDDFIMQLLHQLGPPEAVATEASATTEQFSMPDLTELTAADRLNDLATTCEQILSIEPQPAASAKISPSASPSPSPELLSNPNACDKPLSTPATTTTAITIVENATYSPSSREGPAKAPIVNYTISLPDLGQQLEHEKDSTAAKLQPFQLPPRKASIHSPKVEPPTVAETAPPKPAEMPPPKPADIAPRKPAEMAPSKPAEMAPPCSTAAMFLDALRRQPVRPVRSLIRRRPRSVAAEPAVPRSGVPPTQLVMQFLGRIEAERPKEAKAEGETEVEKEAP